MTRNTVYATDGRFAFSNGTTRAYRRPVIRARYYNVNVRPRLIVESYPVEPGYIWVRGGWTWSGREWQWGELDAQGILPPSVSNSVGSSAPRP